MGATHFIITTNIPADQWWKEEVTGREINAIYRRITRVLHFPELNRFCTYDSYRSYAIVNESPHLHAPQEKEILEEITYPVETPLESQEMVIEEGSLLSSETEESWYATPEIFEMESV